jgi:hypothetical protein
MNKRLTDIKVELEAAELQAKIATVTEAYAESDLALEILSDAMDELEKEAADGGFGDEGLSASQLLSMGVELTEQTLEKIAADESEEAPAEEAAEEAPAEEAAEEASEEAAEESAEEGDLDKEAEAALEANYALAHRLGQELGAIGLTADDIEKVANGPEDEAAQFAELLAEMTAEILSEEA